MLKIAVVENEADQAECLRGYIERFAQEKQMDCRTFVFTDGLDFLSEYKPDFDGVFMDIAMPHLDGMKTVEKLRKTDGEVPVVFVTNMAQFALRGYKVNALDFLVKPVTYFDFALEMEKIVRVKQRRAQDYIWVNAAGVLKKVAYADIFYIEIISHDVCIHLLRETVTFRGSLKNIEEKLDPFRFSRCNNCYIVNLQYVNEIKDDMVLLESGDALHISRLRKKLFLNDLTSYFGSTETK